MLVLQSHMHVGGALGLAAVGKSWRFSLLGLAGSVRHKSREKRVISVDLSFLDALSACKKLVEGETVSDKFTLLIDGDTRGPKFWEPAIEAVRNRGELQASYLFAAPGNITNPDWISKCAQLNIQSMPVPRNTGGAKDPNDIAIGMEAGRLVASGATSVALMVSDADFIYIASRLHALSRKCLAVMLEGQHFAMADAFRRVGADIAWINKEGGDTVRVGTKMIVLNGRGDHEIQPMPKSDWNTVLETSALVNKLVQLQYMETADDPLAPAIAKFYHVNGLWPLRIYPDRLAMAQAVSLLALKPNKRWASNPGDLVFVFPLYPTRNSSSPALMRKYGNPYCASACRGGGPFFCKSSGSLVDEVLTRMGYLDSQLNSDLGEAIDTFGSSNFQTISNMGLRIAPPYLDEHSKRASLHSCLISSKAHGTWKAAPRDGTLRDLLFARGLIESRDTSVDELFECLRKYCADNKLPMRKSYHALVQSTVAHLNRQNPQSRRT